MKDNKYTDQQKLKYWREKIEFACKRIEQIEKRLWDAGRKERRQALISADMLVSMGIAPTDSNLEALNDLAEGLQKR